MQYLIHTYTKNLLFVYLQYNFFSLLNLANLGMCVYRGKKVLKTAVLSHLPSGLKLAKPQFPGLGPGHGSLLHLFLSIKETQQCGQEKQTPSRSGGPGLG